MLSIYRVLIKGNMKEIKFNKQLYSKTALIKAAYNYTDRAYLHLDLDDLYYYVTIEEKPGAKEITEQEFVNEMLTQTVRHEVYSQTKNIRELLLARAMATSIVMDASKGETDLSPESEFNENEILRDWFESNEQHEDTC